MSQNKNKMRIIKDTLFTHLENIQLGKTEDIVKLEIEKAKSTCMIVNTLCNTVRTEIMLSDFNKQTNVAFEQKQILIGE